MNFFRGSIFYAVTLIMFTSCYEDQTKEVIPNLADIKSESNTTSTGMKQERFDWRENPRNQNLDLLPMIVFYPDWMDDYRNHISEVRINLFFHGLGERGSTYEDLDRLLDHHLPRGLPNVTRNEIYLCPQISGNWSGEELERVYDMLLSEFPNALEYGITGLSLGGMGTYNMLAKYPYFFNDAAILSGKMSNPEDKIPMDCSADIIAWHGDQDNVVSYTSGKQTIQRLKNAGYLNRCEFVTISGAKHNIWNNVYHNTNKYFDFVDESTSIDNNDNYPDYVEGTKININYINYNSNAIYQLKEGGQWIKVNEMNQYDMTSQDDYYGLRIYPPSDGLFYDLVIEVRDESGNLVDGIQGQDHAQGEPLILYTQNLNNNYTVNYSIDNAVDDGNSNENQDNIVFNVEYDGYNEYAYYQIKDGSWQGLNGNLIYEANELNDTYGLRVYCPANQGMYDVKIEVINTSGAIEDMVEANDLNKNESLIMYTNKLKNNYTIKYSIASR